MAPRHDKGLLSPIWTSIRTFGFVRARVSSRNSKEFHGAQSASAPGNYLLTDGRKVGRGHGKIEVLE
jgi:hypothetical protein